MAPTDRWSQNKYGESEYDMYHLTLYESMLYMAYHDLSLVAKSIVFDEVDLPTGKNQRLPRNAS